MVGWGGGGWGGLSELITESLALGNFSSNDSSSWGDIVSLSPAEIIWGGDKKQ